MFKPGDQIVYGTNGVCEVVAVGPVAIGSADRDYYTLQPLYATEVIYTPVDTKVFLRPVISRAQAEDLIDRIPSIPEKVCTERSQGLLREHYEAAFHSHNCTDLVQLIKSVYHKGRVAEKEGKKLGQLDLRYMKRAEDILHGELAAALGIERTQVMGYIKTALEGPAA